MVYIYSMRFVIGFVLIALMSCTTSERNSFPAMEKTLLDSLYNDSMFPFYHGVASGDPLEDRVIIWTRITPNDSLPEIEVEWEVAKSKDFNRIVNSGKIKTGPERDYTVKVDVDKLLPGEKYFYRFKALDKTSTIGETIALPENPNHISFAVTSCSNYEFGSFAAYREMAKNDSVDIVLHLGDYIYEYGPGASGGQAVSRTNFPPKEIVSLQDYRWRYAQYRLDQDLQAAHRSHPFISIWDDHEIANNSYAEGAQNHQPEEGSYEVRRNAAQQAYYEWLPVRESNLLYRSFEIGDLADLIMLDERLASRSAPPDSLTDPAINEKSMLGKEQLNWFHQQLEHDNNKWKIIGNQVIFSYLNYGFETFTINLDSWDGYPKERLQIKDWILQDSINNIIFVTGDTHSSWAFEVTENPFDGYNPETAAGAYAIEFGTTSINSGNSNERYPTDTVLIHEQRIVNSPLNPHLKFANLRDHGYMQLSLTPEKARAYWYYIDLKQPQKSAQLSTVMEVKKGTHKLVRVETE